jgi:hypothetical protein
VERVVATFGGVLVLALVAGALTEATLAFGHHGRLTNDALLRPLGTPTPSPSVAPKATPTPKPTATPTPTPTPTATPVAATATTNAFVHMRAGKSTSTAILIDLNGGTVVTLLPDSNAQWQQVRYNGLTGYIFKTYLQY